MAFNPSPKVAVAREVAAKFDAQQVVILYVTETPAGHRSLCYASFGRTKRLCDEAKVLADTAYAALFDKLSE